MQAGRRTMQSCRSWSSCFMITSFTVSPVVWTTVRPTRPIGSISSIDIYILLKVCILYTYFLATKMYIEGV